MAHRSDTSSRDVPNDWRETVLDGEIPDYDMGLSFPYDGDIENLEDDFSGLDVDVSEEQGKWEDRAKILYQAEDRELVYSLVR